MDRTLLSWNLPNWITVMLMAAAGYAVLALVAQIFQKRGGVTAGGGAY
jgi:hypothetical protein